LLSLIEKNQQIEKLKDIFEELEEKLNSKDLGHKVLLDDKKKVEEKLR
jgi:flagellin-specific chaperone FliS